MRDATLLAETFLVPARYCGPPTSGNGGWVGGHAAALVPTNPEHPAVTVRLSAPPPLETPMRVERDGSVVRVWQERPSGDTDDGDLLVVTAAPAPAPDRSGVPAPVAVALAREASSRAPLEGHAFPTCFVCGPGRAAGDGLRIFPGEVTGRAGLHAAPFVPEDSSLELVWAALDCPGAFALDFSRTTMVLGTMTTVVLREPHPGREHVVIGWARGAEGRKRHCGTALYDGDELVAHAEATWLTLGATTPTDTDNTPTTPEESA